MSAFASASGPNALSAFPTVALRREGAATANVNAGTVLPEKNSVPSPRWRPHLHRSAAARTAASRTPRPATTNEGRKGANRVTVSPAAVRNQISIPSRAGRRSSTHPVKCPATCLPRFMSASRRIARPVGRVQMTGAPGSRGLPLGYASMTDRPVKREGRKAVAFTTVHQPSMRGLATAIVIVHHPGSCIHLATGILRNADTPSVDNEDSPQAATAFPLPLDPGVSSFFEQNLRTVTLRRCRVGGLGKRHHRPDEPRQFPGQD